MTFTSIQTNRRRLADEVYDQIVNAIASLEIGPNDRLVQEKLAKQLDISRTPVREALMRLEQEGVLVVSQRGGFRLHRMDDHEVRELYQSRAAVEGQAARILAEKNDPKIISALRKTIKKEEDIKVTTTRAYFEANRNIHRKFIELTDNRYLLEMFDMTWGKAMAFQLFATFENVDITKSLGDHLSLVDAIETGDKTVALEAFIDHINDGFNLQLKGLHAS
ncbi:GntR family transcriptional regulator [Granulosicoccus sp.]|nr:GntR family transcriptional regulator [Granulosicoccus sp.]MDB4223220.1 GntR family transcriptional regulator [Granulosicoccus sp.]